MLSSFYNIDAYALNSFMPNVIMLSVVVPLGEQGDKKSLISMVVGRNNESRLWHKVRLIGRPLFRQMDHYGITDSFDL